MTGEPETVYTSPPNLYIDQSGRTLDGGDGVLPYTLLRVEFLPAAEYPTYTEFRVSSLPSDYDLSDRLENVVIED